MAKQSKKLGIISVTIAAFVITALLLIIDVSVYDTIAVMLIFGVVIISFHSHFASFRVKYEIGTNAMIALFVTMIGAYIGFSFAIRQENSKDRLIKREEIEKSTKRQILLLEAMKTEIISSKDDLFAHETFFKRLMLRQDKDIKNENDTNFVHFQRSVSVPYVTEDILKSENTEKYSTFREFQMALKLAIHRAE